MVIKFFRPHHRHLSIFQVTSVPRSHSFSQNHSLVPPIFESAVTVATSERCQSDIHGYSIHQRRQRRNNACTGCTCSRQAIYNRSFRTAQPGRIPRCILSCAKHASSSIAVQQVIQSRGWFVASHNRVSETADPYYRPTYLTYRPLFSHSVHSSSSSFPQLDNIDRLGQALPICSPSYVSAQGNFFSCR